MTGHADLHAAVSNLQEATLLIGHLRRTLLDELDDLVKVKQALDRAVVALRVASGAATTIGDLIKVRADGHVNDDTLEGRVVATRVSRNGTQVVLLELKPDDPHPRWYRLEQGEYEVMS